MSGIGQHAAPRRSVPHETLDLRQCNCRLGGEHQVLQEAILLPTSHVIGLFLREIQLAWNRLARRFARLASRVGRQWESADVMNRQARFTTAERRTHRPPLYNGCRHPVG